MFPLAPSLYVKGHFLSLSIILRIILFNLICILIIIVFLILLLATLPKLLLLMILMLKLLFVGSEVIIGLLDIQVNHILQLQDYPLIHVYLLIYYIDCLIILILLILVGVFPFVHQVFG